MGKDKDMNKGSVSMSEAARTYTRVARDRGGRTPQGAGGLSFEAGRYGGIPQADLTPAVLSAVTGFVTEIGRLNEIIRKRDEEAALLRQRLALAETFTVIDATSELRTRHAFLQELTRMIAYAGGHARNISLILLTLEGFSPTGTAPAGWAAEEALRQVATALSDSTRTSDLLGRLGPEQFGAVLMDTDEPAAAMIATRMCKAITGRPLAGRHRDVYVAASFGLCRLRPDRSLEDTLAAADADRQRRLSDADPARATRP
ncbi:GGDEF domain-containing protein [Roseospira goensis]|uniref:diguanylate cyclase n=1 Tax=Roseospira goensis TaxID=391922 RepID=A0A7W6WM70_9PROT|nr:GGDEF domain-containing protein [Roseospira goensis]MBB4287458.1 diguanylate cyclase (GGDEF)-like protein [Roseospira goensis]